jgi:hypothetical protein
MAKDEWGEVIYFNDGLTFGVAPDGRTVCLGTDTGIKEILADPIWQSLVIHNNPIMNGIINLERELAGGDNGQSELQRPSTFRSRIIREVKHNTANIKPTPSRRKLPHSKVNR